MSGSHLPDQAPFPPTPQGVVPLEVDLGVANGHRLLLLSLERWDGWADLRFARVDTGDGQRLARRVPPAEQWRVQADGVAIEVVDAVGRGDRWFSNGEARLLPAPAPGSRLHVEVVLAPGAPVLSGEVVLPG
ncbi:MAG: hypothetical protein R6V28_09655 [Nitriliruptoraceae bacterium]